MKKSLLYFDSLCNKIKNTLISEDSKVDTDTNITVSVTDEEGNQIPAEVETTVDTDITEQDINVKVDNVNIDINIKNLKLKLSDKLSETKKKLYASRLYSQNVGNPDALKDYGYFLGQKELLYSILKELDMILPNLTNED